MGRQRSQTTVPGGAQEERVAGYLLEHPGFFDRHPETLLKLELCRRTDGRVASLVERQVARLRERNRELEGRLGDLLEAAGDNERLVGKDSPPDHWAARAVERRTANRDPASAPEAGF